MTEAEVEEILGGPADTPADLPVWDYLTWFGEDDATVRIRITLDDHRVYSKLWTVYSNETFSHKLRRWLHLR